jgi:RHS repeat-associated protein
MRGGSGGLRYYHRNQQYSITAVSDGGGSVVERYAYSAYGQVSFADASGTVQTASVSNNRYTYTGREWDEGLSLYHYRARMYDAVSGRFCGRDPVEYVLPKRSQLNQSQELMADLQVRISLLDVPDALKQRALSKVHSQMAGALGASFNSALPSIDTKTLSNKIAFLDNRPLSSVDPTGEFPWLLCSVCNAPVIWPSWAPSVRGFRIVIPTPGLCTGNRVCRCIACVKLTGFISNGNGGWAISPIGSTDTCP